MRKTKITIFFVMVSIFTLPSELASSTEIFSYPFLDLKSNNDTELNITQASVTYYLNDNGDFSCDFTLLIIGEEQVNFENKKVEFNITGFLLDGFEFTFQGIPLNYNESSFVYFTTINLFLNHTISSNQIYELSGSFRGYHESKQDGSLHYNIGIDWGTKVIGWQDINIIIKDQIHTPQFITNNYSKNKYSVFHTVYQWIFGNFTQKFNLKFDVVVNTTPIVNYLIIEPKNLSLVSLDEKIYIYIKNNGTIDLYLFFLANSDYVFENETEFILKSNQTILLICSPIRTITENISINFIATYGGGSYGNHLEIFYPLQDSLPNFQSILILIIIILGVGIATIYGITNQSKILSIYYKAKTKINFVRSNSIKTLNSFNSEYEIISDKEIAKIRSRWSAILHESEMKIIEFLLFEPEVNQKEIAEGVGYSKMRVSRLVVKLEKKNLVRRNSTENGKIVKLNYKRLLG